MIWETHERESELGVPRPGLHRPEREIRPERRRPATPRRRTATNSFISTVLGRSCNDRARRIDDGKLRTIPGNLCNSCTSAHRLGRLCYGPSRLLDTGDFLRLSLACLGLACNC